MITNVDDFLSTIRLLKKVIRKVVPANNSNSSHDILLKDGEHKIDRNNVAHFINDYFINVGNTIGANSLSSQGSSYLLAEDSSLEDLEKLSLDELREVDVHMLVRGINISKSSGLEDVSSYILKEAFEILNHEVTFMFNLSIRTSVFPQVWKKALVIPIPKQGNLSMVQNYRPISLLPLPGKILEKLIHRQLTSFIETESLLADEQHGFRKDHSTVHAVAQFTSFVSKKMDTKQSTIATFIDFKKAFDCVQHPILLDKLGKMNLDVKLLDWVKSYLSERQQRVLANGNYSSCQQVTQGVPQGSVLGPLFYIIYANDISKIVKKCKIVMYADDTVLYTSHSVYETAVKDMQSDLDSLSKWCLANNIVANTDKTKVMTFGTPTTISRLPPTVITFGNVPLKSVSSYKYLGVTLDKQLNYNLHVKKIIGTVTDKLKQFRRMRSFLNTKAALMVYKGMLLPILEYGDIFLSATTAENRKRLQILQNKGLRCALRRSSEYNSSDLHKEANLMKLKFRREQHLLNFMFDQALNSINHKQRPATAVTTRSQSKKLLKIKRPYSERFKKSLAYNGPKSWNALPERFHHTQIKGAFKSAISTWICKRAATVANTTAVTD